MAGGSRGKTGGREEREGLKQGQSWGQFWSKHLWRALVIFLLVKAAMGLQNVLYPKPLIPSQSLTGKLETVYHQVAAASRLSA